MAKPEKVLQKKIQKYYEASLPLLEKGICPTRSLASASLDKWSLFCIFNLGYHKVLRFGSLKNNIDGISSRMLTVTLRKLVAHRIVERKVYQEVPPKVEYQLTSFGADLADRLIDLSSWVLENSTIEMIRPPAS